MIASISEDVRGSVEASRTFRESFRGSCDGTTPMEAFVEGAEASMEGVEASTEGLEASIAELPRLPWQLPYFVMIVSGTQFTRASLLYLKSLGVQQ